MNMRKTVKKIAALVAGTAMLGATIMGATALDLGNYPAPFVANGVFDGKIVVGAKAQTSDVVGAIDLAASLQASATTTTELNLPGTAGTATVVGDSAEFKTGSNVVGLGEAIGDVKKTFTASDLDALKNGVLQSGTSTTPVKQYLKFENVDAAVVYEENEDDEVADFLKFTDGDFLFEYQLEFTEGAVSEIDADDDSLTDLKGEVLSILGSPFTIVDSEVDTTNKDITLTLLGGEVADTLRDGETKTYTIGGKDYEVTAVFISSDDQTAKLSVDGKLTKELGEGETDILSSDVTIGVQEVLTNQREGLVEFYLGANKIELTDTTYNTDSYDADGVEIKGEGIDEDDEIQIRAADEANGDLKINYIKYRVSGTEDYYIPAGHGLKEFLTNDGSAMLTDNWDIKYAGLVKTSSSVIKYDAQSDHTYDFDFTNVNGDNFKFALMTNHEDAPDTDTATLDWGNKDDPFIFEEYINGTDENSDASTFIPDNAYFIVSDDVGNTKDAVTTVLRYSSLSEGDSTVTFKNLAGDEIVVSYTGNPGSTATGDLIVDGETHVFYVGDDSATDSEAFALSIDLNGDGTVDLGDQVFAVAKGGAIVDFGDQDFESGSGDLLDTADEASTITTDGASFDVDGGDEVSTVTISAETGNEVDVAVTTLSSLDGTFELVQDPANDEMERGYTTYGALFELNNPSSDNSAAELSIDYPLNMRAAQVFVTAGTVEVKEGTSTTGGSASTTEVNPIAVGLAVLDTEAPVLGSQKMIVVGGPCVNTVAAQLMGNPVDCTAGFTPGKAIIKLYADKNALLVAGYAAQDTLGACYVLSDYADYDLTGTEVEVVVADLNTITVNKVN